MTTVPPSDERVPDEAPEPAPRLLDYVTEPDLDRFAVKLAQLLIRAAGQQVAAEKREGES